MEIVLAEPGDADVVFAMATALSLDGPLDRMAFNTQFDEVLRSERSVALLATDDSGAVGRCREDVIRNREAARCRQA